MYLNFIDSPETMDINSNHGDKIIYLFPENGSPDDHKTCSELLDYKMVYTVDEMSVGGSMSRVKLMEFGDKWFNTVMFDNYEPLLYSPNNEYEKSIIQEYRVKITELKEKADRFDELYR